MARAFLGAGKGFWLGGDGCGQMNDSCALVVRFRTSPFGIVARARRAADVPRPILALALERQSEADAGVANPPSLHCPRPRVSLVSLQKNSFLKYFFVAILLLAGAVREHVCDLGNAACRQSATNAPAEN